VGRPDVQVGDCVKVVKERAHSHVALQVFTELADEAFHALLLMLQCHQSVTKEQLIDFHCFTGSLSMLKKWLEVFPNTYIGFTVISCWSMDYQETVIGVESSRLSWIPMLHILVHRNVIILPQI
jgi:Tat protein secretion system quality control protein TatD with DNase activity